MSMSFEWFVARRYLTARRKQAFISLISGVSILGVGVGVMALIIALALMTGVQSELQEHINGYTAHVYVYPVGAQGFSDVDAEVRRFSTLPGVEGAAPAVHAMALLGAAGSSEPVPADLWGIDPALERTVIKLDGAMKTGGVSALMNRPEGSREGIILGADLASRLGVSRGDMVTLITLAPTLSPLGPMAIPKTLTVVGTFQFGFFEFDQTSAFMSLNAAEQAFKKVGPDLIQLRLRDMNSAPAFKTELQRTLGPTYLVDDWLHLNKSLYSALGLEKLAISLTIGLIVLVAALNIVASLVLLVMEKSRDIAILRTMGAPAGAIRRIFMYQGLTIGLIGTGSGAVLGLLVCFVADRYRLIALPADIYQISYLPFRVLPLDVAVVVLGAVAVCFLATLYPSRQAGRLDPAEVLRNQ
jgi:lipoprotein-releasing system permease protein